MIEFFRKLWPFIHISRVKVAALLVLNTVQGVFAVSTVAFLYPVVNYIYHGRDAFVGPAPDAISRKLVAALSAVHLEPTLGVLLACLAAAMSLQNLAKYGSNVLAAMLQQEISYKVREKVCRAVLSADLGLFLNLQIGDAANSLTMESFRVGHNVRYFVAVLTSSALALLYLALLFVTAPALAVFAVAGVSVFPLISRFHSKSLRSLGSGITQASARMQAFLNERFRQIERVKILAQEDNETRSFAATARELERSTVQGSKRLALVQLLTETALFLVLLGMVFVGFGLLKVPFSTFMVSLYLLTQCGTLLIQAAQNKGQVDIYTASQRKVLALYEQALAYQRIRSGPVAFPGVRNALVFSKVRFEYDAHHPVFGGLDVTFAARRTTALVGGSGCGKSTIVRLLLRFYDVNDGAILADGVDIRQFQLSGYRRRFAVLSQDLQLFTGTVRDNLTYGLDPTSDQTIERHCATTGASEVLARLSGGLDARVGEGGFNLSGGQKQRLLISHVMLQDPDIIILDEPTSALDADAELTITEMLKTLHGKKTIVVVAHRLSTIRSADHIVVVGNGGVMEQGSHEQLVGLGGVYKRMVEVQRLSTGTAPHAELPIT